jgi:probable HAF family extracellular repeat protein
VVRYLRLGLAVALAVAIAPAPSIAQRTTVQYDVVNLGTLPGFDGSRAAGINESGQVVGTLQDLPYGDITAFVWDRATGIRALGHFQGRGTEGSGINDDGQVAGSAVGTVYNPGFAFRWDPEAGFERLDPPPNVFGSSGSGINDAGEVAGAAQVSGPYPVRWTSDGEVQLLGSLGANQGIALGINEGGQIVGYSRNSRGYPRPFLWTPGAGMIDLGTFRGGQSSAGIASAVNDLGHVAGDADTSDIGRAFLWRGGRLIGIGPELSYAYALNELDHVVGQFYVGGGVHHAFRWRGGTFRDLNALIPAGRGIVLNDARGINDAGWIVANGTSSRGKLRAFLLIPR